MQRRSSHRAPRRGDGATAGVVAGAWGAAEALWLPVMPDVAVAVLTLWTPGRWRRLAGAAIAGSLLGGTVAHRLGASGRRPPLLLVTPAMSAAVDHWLADEGARGVLRQPLSGVPFKVFAYGAAPAGVTLPGLLLWAGLGRGARLLGVAWAFARVGRIAARGRSPVPRIVSAAASIVGFGFGLRAVVRRWT